MTSLNGHLLVASPKLVDTFFHESVILILAHSDEGAAGLVINRPTEATVSDLSESIFQGDFTWNKSISLGGPVPGPLVVLHSRSRLADQEVCPGVYSTIEEEKVRDALRARLDPSIVAINYSGWGPGQLERELSEDSWEVVPAAADLVFSPPKQDLWREATRRARSLKMQSLFNLPGFPDDPGWN